MEGYVIHLRRKRNVARKSEEKRQPDTQRSVLENKMKIDLNGIRCDSVHWNHLAQVSYQWRAL